MCIPNALKACALEKVVINRIHDRKRDVIIYDYVDLGVPVLERMYERRIKGYRSIGYGIEMR